MSNKTTPTQLSKAFDWGDFQCTVDQYYNNQGSYHRIVDEQVTKFQERYAQRTAEDKKAAGRLLEDGLTAGRGIVVDKLPSGTLRISVAGDYLSEVEESVRVTNHLISQQNEVIAELRELIADLMAAVFEDVA